MSQEIFGTEDSAENGVLVLPLLPLRGLTVFPHMTMQIDVGREKSMLAVRGAVDSYDDRIFLVTQLDPAQDEPSQSDLYEIGVIAEVKNVSPLPGDAIRLVAEGLSRARILRLSTGGKYAHAEIAPVDEELMAGIEAEAYCRVANEAFETFVKLSARVPAELAATASAISEPGQLADVIAAHAIMRVDERQRLLETIDPKERISRATAIIERENQLLAIEREIREKVKQQIDKNQRDYYLREQMRAIRKELGDGDPQESDELREKLAATQLNDEAKQKVERELKRLSRMSPQSPEVGVIRSWVEWVLDMPWGKLTEDNHDIAHAKKVLDEDHFGLHKVKERVLEYLAVLALKKDMKGSILCFVGPPGVGKTSVSRSVARAMDRKFTRISLGGLRDEAEIRGHRRTYIGAIPGQIIAHIKQAGSMNPVFLLDEVDKLQADFRGDPAAALLEVLDAEQNGTFRDNYLEIPFDLSHVLFLTTANTLDTIPRPLLDRMEIIEIAGYTEDEKLRIAQDHLLPKQIKEHGMSVQDVQLTDSACLEIIRRHTREAGVRQLERKIAKLCRKAAVRAAKKDGARTRITPAKLEDMLGVPPYSYGRMDENAQVGVVTGLAWTGAGGDTLPVEVAVLPGTGKLELTGHLGEVMQESARAALSCVRARAEELGLERDFHEKIDIHIHVPEGAVPKDGPSAGVTIACALVSALTGIPAHPHVAMTGEITLNGRILPIGGLKEKAMAARRAGVTTVLFPEKNKPQLSEIEPRALAGLELMPIATLDEALDQILLRQPGSL